MSKKKSMFNSGDKLFLDRNFQISRLYIHFSLLAKARFEWSNLPNGIKSEYIETFLYEHGQVGFYNDETLGFITLPCNGVNGLNIYNEHKQFMLSGHNYQKVVYDDEMVRIKANDDCISLKSYVAYYTDLIEEIERTYLINLNQQKLPKIMPATKEVELSIRNMCEKVENGDMAIFLDPKLEHILSNSLSSIDMSAPFLLDKLQKAKIDAISELQTLLGYNNSNNIKKERMLVDEININNNEILVNLELEYKNRLLACKQINEKYGLDIRVEKVIDKIQVDFNGKATDIIT